ncbi:MAG: glycosyltransferase 87 family protein [Acidobacteria bacterium]|nr:glycosyltransferase 87 family protein [Acidobacteriota bacterium]
MAASPQPSGHPAPPKTDRAVLALSLIAFLGCCAGWLWLALNFPETGWDFTEFYLAGRVPVGSLYDQTTFQEYGQRLLLPLGIDYYPPYVRPAVFSLLLRPLMLLNYWPAYWTWAALQFICYLAAIFLLRTRFPFAGELIVGFGLFYPGMMGIVTGQDAHTFTLLLTAGLLLLLKEKPIIAGLVLALCLYKFNLILLIPLLLLVKKEYRALASMAGGGAILAAASALVTSPAQYIELLTTIPEYTISFEPEKVMIGFRAVAHGLGYPVLYYPLAALGAVGSILAMRKLPMAMAFCVAVLGSVLIAYHVTWYDGVCLIIPIIAAMSTESKLANAPAIFLLFLFPLWPYSKLLTCAFITLLWIALALPGMADNKRSTNTEPATG